MEMDDRAHWIFGPFELVRERGLLEKDGERVAISPKPPSVLVHLIANRERVVPRSELLEAVWPGVTVSEAAFLSVLRDLRRALDDDARQPRYVATERGRGLHFNGSVYQLPDAGHQPETPGDSEVWERAAINLERALVALDAVEQVRGTAEAAVPPSRSRGELLVALGRARWAAGQPEQARQDFLAATRIARSTGDAESLAWAALGYVGRTDASLTVNREAVVLLEEALAGLPREHTVLRAELLARLGTELYNEKDGARSRALTDEAVVLCEQLGSPRALAYAITAQHYARTRPEVDPAERVPLCERVIELVGEDPATDVVALALQQLQVERLEQGDGPAYRQALARHAAIAEAVALPFFRWTSAVYAGNRALLRGEVEDAEGRASANLDLGQRIASPNALPIYAAQLFALRFEQGRLGELAPLLQAEADRNPDVPIFRCALPAILAGVAQPEPARALLRDVLGDGLDRVPRDMQWIACLGLLASAAATLADRAAIKLLEPLLRPYAGRVIVLGYGAAIHGAVDHHLGLMAAARGGRDEAAGYLAAACALHERLGASLWAARSAKARQQLAE